MAEWPPLPRLPRTEDPAEEAAEPPFEPPFPAWALEDLGSGAELRRAWSWGAASEWAEAAEALAFEPLFFMEPHGALPGVLAGLLGRSVSPSSRASDCCMIGSCGD